MEEEYSEEDESDSGQERESPLMNNKNNNNNNNVMKKRKSYRRNGKSYIFSTGAIALFKQISELRNVGEKIDCIMATVQLICNSVKNYISSTHPHLNNNNNNNNNNNISTPLTPRQHLELHV